MYALYKADICSLGMSLHSLITTINFSFSVFCLIASVLSLTLIAYDRFFGIVFALKAHMSNRKARFSIAIIWIVAFAIASPLLRFRELKVRQWQDYTELWCDDDWPIEMTTDPVTNITTQYQPARRIYFTFVSAVLYFFPMIVMALVYSVIIWKLRATTMPGERVDSGYAAQQKTKRKVYISLHPWPNQHSYKHLNSLWVYSVISSGSNNSTCITKLNLLYLYLNRVYVICGISTHKNKTLPILFVRTMVSLHDSFWSKRVSF